MKARFDNKVLIVHAKSPKEAAALIKWMNDAQIMGVQCDGGMSAIDPQTKHSDEALMHLRVSERPLLVDTAAGPKKATLVKAKKKTKVKGYKLTHA